MTSIKIVKDEGMIARCDVCAPVFGGFNKIAGAETVDEIKEIIRNAVPVNKKEAARVGIMRVDVKNVAGFNPITYEINAVTFDVEDVYLTTGTVLGEDSRTYYVQDFATGEIRRLSKNATYFFIAE